MENRFGNAKAYIDLTVIGNTFSCPFFADYTVLTEQIKSPLLPMLAPQLKALHDGPILSEPKQRVELKVGWSGKPEPVISWSKGADKIQPNQKFETIAIGSTFVLVIHGVCF